jgi:hypothetical protein
MKYLVTLAPAQVGAVAAGEDWAGGGEPVIPWFPAPVRNVFLSTTSWKFAPYATVIDSTFNLDSIVEALCIHYPGLPRTLHENYVLETAVAASRLSVGNQVSPIINENSAQIQVKDTNKLITLWTAQPIKMQYK